MAYARIVTSKRGTVIRSVKFVNGTPTKQVDQIATTLESAITDDRDILKVETDYTGCDDSTSPIMLYKALQKTLIMQHRSSISRLVRTPETVKSDGLNGAKHTKTVRSMPQVAILPTSKSKNKTSTADNANSPKPKPSAAWGTGTGSSEKMISHGRKRSTVSSA